MTAEGHSIVDEPMKTSADLSRSPIAIENSLPGSAGYQLGQPADLHQVEGYASVTSAAAGDTVELAVNVDHDQEVRWELYRRGYYQGSGGRRVAVGTPRLVAVQPPCPLDTTTGLIECAWASAFKVEIDPPWLTGYYTFKLINQDGFEAEVPLIVRESGRRAPLLMHANVNTWQAYNVWGGTSIYKNLTPPASHFTAAKATRVSFDRPYASQNSLTPWLAALSWIEKNGYDVSYVTNVDLDADSGLLAGRTMLLSVGHDEYISQTERNAVVAARNQGVSLGFVSANGMYRRVDLVSSSRGVARRIMVHRNRFSVTRPRQPPNELVGLLWVNWSSFPNVPFVAVHSDHWIYEGTGVRDFDTLGNQVGAEWDAVSNDAASPPGLEIVGDSPALDESGLPTKHSNASIYYPTPGSLVFAAGSINWAYGLGDDSDYGDIRIKRMMQNVLTRAGLPPPVPAMNDPLPPATEVESSIAARSNVIAGTGENGYADGPASAALFETPAGIAAGPNGELYVTDIRSALVRKIEPDGRVSTMAGCPPDVSTPPTDCLGLPIGIAIDRGVVYVADASSHQIRAILADGRLVTYAGTGNADLVDAADPLQASFAGPRGLAVGPVGELYVADTQNGAIRRIDAGGVTTLATGLHKVTAVAVDENGVVYFSSIADGQIGMIENREVHVLANASGIPGDREGPGVTARLRPLEGLLVEAGRLVFADTGNYRVRALALTGKHDVSTLAGDGRAGLDLSTGPHLVLPRGLAPYRGGYAVTDSGNHRILWVSDPE